MKKLTTIIGIIFMTLAIGLGCGKNPVAPEDEVQVKFSLNSITYDGLGNATIATTVTIANLTYEHYQSAIENVEFLVTSQGGNKLRYFDAYTTYSFSLPPKEEGRHLPETEVQLNYNISADDLTYKLIDGIAIIEVSFTINGISYPYWFRTYAHWVN